MANTFLICLLLFVLCIQLNLDFLFLAINRHFFAFPLLLSLSTFVLLFYMYEVLDILILIRKLYIKLYRIIIIRFNFNLFFIRFSIFEIFKQSIYLFLHYNIKSCVCHYFLKIFLIIFLVKEIIFKFK